MWLGDYTEDFATVTCMFTTHSSTGAPVAPSTAFEAADVIIYKNGSATQKTTTNGVTMTSPFDTVTGLHCVVIDTSNDTGDAGFWVAGAVYTLVLSPDETVDSVAVAKVIGQFGIEVAGALRPTTASRKLDVTATGAAGIDWGNVENPTTAVNLSGTNIKTDQKVDVETIKTQTVTLSGGVTIPAATLASTTNITGGTITTATNVTTVNGLAAGVITAASIAADAITDAKVAADVTIASVTGAVGSVTGNVGGNVAGTIGGLTAAAIKDFFDTDSTTTYASAVAGSVVKEIADNAGGSALTAAAIADAVWDEDATAHQTQGSFGQAIGDPVADTNTIFKAVVTDAAGATVGIDVVAVKAETASIQSDTNDLQTQVGTAGAGLTNINLPDQTMNITGNITGNVSGSVGSVTGLTASDVGSIKAKTDSLTFTMAGHVDANVQRVNDVTIIGDGSGTPFQV